MKKTPLMVSVVLMTMTTVAAAAVTGGNLPWEAPLQTIVTSLTGPVAFAGSAIALTAAFLTLAFNSEITGFARYLVYLALAISGLLFILNLLTTVFGAGSAITSGLVVMQVGVTVLFLAGCCVLAALECLLWRGVRRMLPARPFWTLRGYRWCRPIRGVVSDDAPEARA